MVRSPYTFLTVHRFTRIGHYGQFAGKLPEKNEQCRRWDPGDASFKKIGVIA
jgi:hypothetical protein